MQKFQMLRGRIFKIPIENCMMQELFRVLGGTGQIDA